MHRNIPIWRGLPKRMWANADAKRNFRDLNPKSIVLNSEI